MSNEPRQASPAEAEALLESSLPLALGIAGYYTNIPGVTLDELRSEARLATWDAAKTFDASRGILFSRYAGTVIRNRLKSLARQTSTRLGRITHSLDHPLSDDGEETMVDQIPQEGNDVPDHACMREAAAVLGEIISQLPDRQREYALGCLRGDSDAETARKMGIQRQSLHVIKMNALAEIRRKLACAKIDEVIVLHAKPKLDPGTQHLDLTPDRLAEIENYNQALMDSFDLPAQRQAIEVPERQAPPPSAPIGLHLLSLEDRFDILLPGLASAVEAS